MAEGEIPLTGGNVATVVRVGNTVRRSTTSQSATIHALLRHLEQVGFTGCPRFLGIDGNGREILSFLPGDVGVAEYLWEDRAVVAAAHLLRDYHVATTTFIPPVDAHWQQITSNEWPHEVICHHDFAPYNLVCQDQQPVALIDFDLARPGPRLRDVAYGVYWFAPLSFSSDLTALARADMQNNAHRLKLFCHSYGIEPTAALLDMVVVVLNDMCNWLQHGANQGDTNAQRMIAEGHLAHWQRELLAFHQQRPALEAAIIG
jgi:hypothetical protein